MKRLTHGQRLQLGGKTQESYEAILEELASVRAEKVNAYGEDAYNDPDAAHQQLIRYSDIYRKFIRIKTLMLQGKLKAQDGESLEETLADMANYSIMAIQHLRANKGVLVNEPVPEFSGMVIDQVAFSCDDPDYVRTRLQKIFGRPLKWSDDYVTATGTVFGENAENSANLSFNYELLKNGLELELLEYESGDNWVEQQQENYGDTLPVSLSHLGVHVPDLEPYKQHLISLGYEIAQEVWTDSHTNPAIKDSRRYHYCIFDTRAEIGFDLKLIQRLPYNPTN